MWKLLYAPNLFCKLLPDQIRPSSQGMVALSSGSYFFHSSLGSEDCFSLLFTNVSVPSYLNSCLPRKISPNLFSGTGLSLPVSIHWLSAPVLSAPFLPSFLEAYTFSWMLYLTRTHPTVTHSHSFTQTQSFWLYHLQKWLPASTQTSTWLRSSLYLHTLPQSRQPTFI